MEITSDESLYELKSIRISGNASITLDTSRNIYHPTLFAGVNTQGGYSLGAFDEIDLSSYQYLDIDVLVFQNNNTSLNGAFVGVTSTYNLNNTGTDWYTDLTNYVSSGSFSQAIVHHFNLDLSSVNKEDLKSARIYIKCYSGFSGGGIWLSPLHIKAYN